MRHFYLDKVYALDEAIDDLEKDTIIGVDEDGDWFILDRMEDVEDTPKGRLEARRSFANALAIGMYEENEPTPFFRDYWSYMCSTEHLEDTYLKKIIVSSRKTQILGIMPELA